MSDISSSINMMQAEGVLTEVYVSEESDTSSSIDMVETIGATSHEQEENGDRPSTDTKNSYSGLVNIVKMELETLPQLADFECCIFRVPERLRELNEKAYTPRVVSIGPLHHGKENLKAMEEHKRRFLKVFLENTGASLEDCVKVIKEKEKRLRNNYAESIQLSSDKFVEMILVDAIFLIELFLRYYYREFSNDCIDRTPKLKWDIRYDLCLLENQIPFFILVDLFKLAKRNIPGSPERDPALSMMKLILWFGKSEWDFSIMEDHLEKNLSSVRHIVDLLAYAYQPSSGDYYRGSMEILNIPRAMELHQAGVKLELGSSENLFDIRFEGGVLKIPRLRVGDSAKIVLRNLLAYEQCHCYKWYIAEYVVFMNYLLRSAKDVELLIEKGVIENWLQNTKDVSILFKDLAQDLIINTDDYLYGVLVDELNEYRNIWWRKSIAILQQDYFNSPWATLSVMAAVFLLILTIVQTVCSIIQL